MRGPLKIAENVFHQNHRRVHDDAEIHCADGQQVRAFIAQHEDDDGEEQRERNVDADDERAAQVAEENPLDEKHQQTSENQVVQDGVGGEGDEIAAVVNDFQLDAGREAAVVIHCVNRGFDLGQHVVGVLRSLIHHHDAHHAVRIVVVAPHAEARANAHGHFGNIFHQHGHAVVLRQHYVFDIVHFAALRQVVVAAVVHQTDAANIDGLLADLDFASADVDVGVAERGNNLRHGDAVKFQFVRVRFHVELLGGTAPRIDLHNTGNRQQSRNHDEVADGAEIHHAEMRRADDLVTDDLADAAVLLDVGLHAAGQAGVLLQRDDGGVVSGVVFHAVFENDADKRQAVK